MNRLKRQHDFDLVFSKGKKSYAKSVCLVYLKQGKDTLIGISVSKKHGKAVIRNKIKRLLRAVYYPLIPRLKKGYMMVFVPKVTDEYSYETFFRDVLYLLNKESIFGDVE